MYLLRLNLAALFLWFGFSQLINSLDWVNLVPTWASDLLHMPPAMIVMLNGSFEVLAASLLAMGFFVRTLSFLLALHLMPIALSFGGSATGVRDLGLAISSLSLSLIYTKELKAVEEKKTPTQASNYQASQTFNYKTTEIYPNIPNKK